MKFYRVNKNIDQHFLDMYTHLPVFLSEESHVLQCRIDVYFNRYLLISNGEKDEDVYITLIAEEVYTEEDTYHRFTNGLCNKINFIIGSKLPVFPMHLSP